jgi:predicted TIM-barrel fold metal-dependent hydrolase
MEYFFDQHFHVMTLEHPNLLSFMSTIKEGLPDLLTSGALSPSYILSNRNLLPSQMLTKIMNTLTTFEQPIGLTFAMMEDDLAGKFKEREKSGEYPAMPYIRDSRMHMRSFSYDKMAMCPLLMDFSQSPRQTDNLYYPSTKQEKIIKYAKDTLAGIDWYHENRPDGLFEFFPFIGINPPVHSARFIQDLLETYVSTRGKRGKRRRFAGVKFYPPLGYNPWPSDEKEREKVCMIYEFCQRHEIPIITHCDDQGFRGISPKEAWIYTAPSSFRPVMEHYPTLKIDFAHYGWQYNQMQKNPLNRLAAAATKVPDSPWFYELVDLMDTYPNVYADVSFSGSTPEFYQQLRNYIQSQPSAKAETIRSRTMFGSDFCVNLFKVESYSSYYRIFEQSPFGDDEIDAFANKNPARFMGLGN